MAAAAVNANLNWYHGESDDEYGCSKIMAMDRQLDEKDFFKIMAVDSEEVVDSDDSSEVMVVDDVDKTDDDDDSSKIVVREEESDRSSKFMTVDGIEETDDDNSSKFMTVDGIEETDDDDSFKIMTVDGIEETDDDDDSFKIMTMNREQSDVGDIVRYCSDFVCKDPHTNEWFGGPLWDVISIKIRRNMKYHDSEVRIHGAIRVCTNNHFTDYLFKRKKADAQVFEDPGEVLTLSLVGPHKPWVLQGFSCQPGLTLYALLKYNDQNIFATKPGCPPEHYNTYLKGCPERYRDVNNWGDFEDYSDLFSGKGDDVDPVVGYGWFCVPCISTTGVENKVFRFHNPILDKVASVEVEWVHIYAGLVARVKVRCSRDQDLYGEISARCCLFKNGVMLFHKTQKEAMTVKSNESILLSRSMASVDSQASLVIKFYVQDANDSNFLVDETIQFNTLPKGCVSQSTTSNGVFSVDVEWIDELYGGTGFHFPE